MMCLVNERCGTSTLGGLGVGLERQAFPPGHRGSQFAIGLFLSPLLIIHGKMIMHTGRKPLHSQVQPAFVTFSAPPRMSGSWVRSQTPRWIGWDKLLIACNAAFPPNNSSSPKHSTPYHRCAMECHTPGISYLPLRPISLCNMYPEHPQPVIRRWKHGGRTLKGGGENGYSLAVGWIMR